MPNFMTTGEQIEPIRAAVSGTIPHWLNGQLVRVGPGVFDLHSGFTVTNFIDGYATLFKFSIGNSQVFCSQRFLQTEAFDSARRVGKPIFAEFGTRAYPDPSKGILENVLNNFLPEVTDNTNSGLMMVGPTMFATHEMSRLCSVHRDDLSTGEKVDLFKLLGVHMICPRSLRNSAAEKFTVMTSIMRKYEYYVVKISSNCYSSAIEALKKSEIIATIRSRKAHRVSYNRTFAQANDYIVFIEQPCTLGIFDVVANRINGKSFKQCLKWSPDVLNRFYIVDKASGAITSTVYESEKPFFFFHDINAYEHDNEIIVDLVCYDDIAIINHHDMKNLRGERVVSESQGRRFILPIIGNIKDVPEGINLVKSNENCKAVRHGNVIRVDYQVLCKTYHEFPSVNGKHFGKKYRYYYATSNLFKCPFEFSIIKVDVENCEVKTWFAGDGQIPSEPIFVEKPDSSSEDDGVLLVSISSLAGDTNRLVIIDASSMELIASASVPFIMPATLSGMFCQS